MNTQEFFNKYDERCARESALQGIDDLISELATLGVKAESAQTGGFTMCAYVEVGEKYIYANPYGFSLYDEEGFESNIFDLEEGDTKRVASELAKWLGAK